jgi:hypothetical protein
MRKIIGSRRGKHLLPLSIQWPVFIVAALVSLLVVLAWMRGGADSYPHEHARMALLSCGFTLMAAAGLVRQNRKLHIVLFVSGGGCVICASVLR